PVRESGERGRHGEDQARDEGDPPAERAGALRDAEHLRERCNGCERVDPNRRVGERRMKRVAGKPVPQITELHSGRNLTLPARVVRYDSCASRKLRNAACLASRASISATPAPAQSSTHVSLRSSSI